MSLSPNDAVNRFSQLFLLSSFELEGHPSRGTFLTPLELLIMLQGIEFRLGTNLYRSGNFSSISDLNVQWLRSNILASNSGATREQA
jgi:hypothetical protein